MQFYCCVNTVRSSVSSLLFTASVFYNATILQGLHFMAQRVQTLGGIFSLCDKLQCMTFSHLLTLCLLKSGISDSDSAGGVLYSHLSYFPGCNICLSLFLLTEIPYFSRLCWGSYRSQMLTFLCCNIGKNIGTME